MGLLFELQQRINEFGLTLSAKELTLFEIYLQILQEWNKKINITAIKTTKDIIIKHFIDSLAVLKYINISGSLVDIGSGGGFPGIPIKINNPSIELTLIEANRKKSNFLKTVIRRLGLKHVDVYNGRAEHFDKECFFDIAISRAFANVADFCTVAGRLVKNGGMAVAMTGKFPLQNDEQIYAAGFIRETSFSFDLPLNKGHRTILVLRKCFT
ncbi:MAG: 16S rRNA (guanine(527)-N(7))-methyltransferase RsmG [Desulfobacterota bacterium]|nr:16S rRNA (guanine(527)-N(7))-methyltransferase RsmG [Thermodesulfobacteriota bacterium]